MASGKLGVAAPAANTHTTVYTVPAATVATLNIAVVNRGEGVAVVDVAVATTETPHVSEYIECGVSIPAHGVLERSAVVVGVGERVVVRSSTVNCSVRVHGFEEIV